MCNKKVTQKENGDWTCAGGHVSAYPEFRYLCRMNILDHTDAQQTGMAYDGVGVGWIVAEEMVMQQKIRQ